MSKVDNKYIELNRSFFELSDDYSKSADTDEINLYEALGLRVAGAITWDKLTPLHRVILLAEAGAGKTEELIFATNSLRGSGKSAFFLRLEHIASDLENAFEIGDLAEFEDWQATTQEAWIFLDSIDEARLKSPKDFEYALKVLARSLARDLNRVHVVISSRVNAWRPKSDLELCEKYLPFSAAKTIDEDSTSEDEGELPDPSEAVAKFAKTTQAENPEDGFSVYALNDLSTEQVKRFAEAKGVHDVSALLDDIERHEAQAFTARPQDLEEVIDFWRVNKKIGSRLELMRHSINRRLTERDQNRDETHALSNEELRSGAKLVAAAATFAQKSRINVPDGAHDSSGLNITAILQEWSPTSCNVLLSRPIFEPEIYGTVRFHHRTVREYLTAEWLSDLLKQETSRKNIERLFFKNQYGLSILTPALRPVLSWLLLLDTKILDKVCSVEPEHILDGGDPSQLPKETRVEILRSVCEKMADEKLSHSYSGYAAVQRFANSDLAEEIESLANQYKSSNEVLSFLFRMIWQGKISSLLPLVLEAAKNSRTEKYTRIAAIRATKEVGQKTDFDQLLGAISRESTLDRRIFSELIEGLDDSLASITWTFNAIETLEEKEQYEVDHVCDDLAQFAKTLSPDNQLVFINQCKNYLDKPPVIERRFCEISEHFGWLMKPSLSAIEALIIQRHQHALHEDVLTILALLPNIQNYSEYGCSSRKLDLTEQVREWKELNHALFWASVKVSRASLDRRKGETLTDWWQVSIFGRNWHFTEGDFDLIKSDIVSKSNPDDQLVALTLAFQIYKENGRPAKWRIQLKKLVATDVILAEKLHNLLHPPKRSEQERKWKQQEAYWKRRDRQHKEKRLKFHSEWKGWLSENTELLQRDDLFVEGKIINAQTYLLDRMRKFQANSSQWSQSNWQDLVSDYSVEVATAFRNGLVNGWRKFTPNLRSDVEDDERTSYAVILGLAGIEIESNETPKWPRNLSVKDAEIACRYALCELNGLPDWMPKIYDHFPDVVQKVVLNEVAWEVKSTPEDKELHYLLNRLSWSCKWLWDAIAPGTLEILRREPKNLQTLNYLLRIVNGSANLSSQALSSLAKLKCAELKDSAHLAYWYSVWIGVDPQIGIAAFDTYLNKLDCHDIANKTAMSAIVNLMGDRRHAGFPRENFVTPIHLKQLYLLANQFICPSEDIHRAGKGVYTPELRDDAQEARSALFSTLKEIPGKETYLAILDIVENLADDQSKPWLLRCARVRAEIDGDLSKWMLDQFVDFVKNQEFTPSNHLELARLTVLRLEDLKEKLENGDTSPANILKDVTQETKVRNYIAGWLRDSALGRYSIAQEDELADATRPDIRILGMGFDGPVPIELKLADNWTGPELLGALKNQLCNDYLRDLRSNIGIYLLVYRGEKKQWKLPGINGRVSFPELLQQLEYHWLELSGDYPNIDDIHIVGIDLTLREL